MQDRYEATSEVARRLHPTSQLGDACIELAVHYPPAPASASLPEAYGVLRFELLVVDPEWAFVIWEVPLTAIEDGATLLLRFLEAGSPNSALAGFNLYGGNGRWFVHAALPGRTVDAVLGWAVGMHFCELARRGPIHLPRNFTVDAEHFDELSVDYERGPGGQLLLRAAYRQQTLPWPAQLGPAAYPSQALDWLDGADSDHPGSSGRNAARSIGSSGRGGSANV
jgi:hypothetical protein